MRLRAALITLSLILASFPCQAGGELAGFEVEYVSSNPTALEEIVPYFDFSAVAQSEAFRKLRIEHAGLLDDALNYLPQRTLAQLYPELNADSAWERWPYRTLNEKLALLDLEKHLDAPTKARVMALLTKTGPKRNPAAFAKILPLKANAPDWIRTLAIEIDGDTIELKLRDPIASVTGIAEKLRPLAEATGRYERLWQSGQVSSRGSLHLHVSNPELARYDLTAIAEHYQDLMLARELALPLVDAHFSESGGILERSNFISYKSDVTKRGLVRVINGTRLEVRMATTDVPSLLEELDELLVRHPEKALSLIDTKIQRLYASSPSILDRLIRVRPDIAWKFKARCGLSPERSLEVDKRIFRTVALGDPQTMALDLPKMIAAPKDFDLAREVLIEIAAEKDPATLTRARAMAKEMAKRRTHPALEQFIADTAPHHQPGWTPAPNVCLPEALSHITSALPSRRGR